MASLRTVEWVHLDHAARTPVEVGDLVSFDAGGMPIYRVVALTGREVWVRDERRSAPRVMLLDDFRWRGEAASA